MKISEWSLSTMLTSPPWQAKAACREAPTESFFPVDGQVTAETRAICTSCEVRTECRDYALRTRQDHGIWGGAGEKDRERMRRASRRNTARRSTA